ncbi:MAG: hypothetical protein V2J65_15520 [Desulfobacteraceae bacterium]|jgi:hypothetical protein|nr:hypothetical protein [Desulfobacteraceae bacterium]
MTKHQNQTAIKNPGMRNYLERREAHGKVNAVIKRHLEAMAKDLAVELAKSIDPDSEFGQSFERFIDFGDQNSKTSKKQKVSIDYDIVSFAQSTLPETYKAIVEAKVNLDGRKEGCFPFDIVFELKPFDYKARAIREISTWHTNIEWHHSPCHEDTDVPEDVVDELSDMLGDIEMDFDFLEDEDDEDSFWGIIDGLKDKLREADDLLAEYNEDWANQEGLMRFY